MFLVQACSYKSRIDPNYYCQKLKFSCIQSNKIVKFKTSKGDFEVKLFGKDNPVTVSNFIENIENNVADLEVQKGMGKKDAKIVDKIINKYEIELKNKIVQNEIL